jgi:hypothetical protein
VDALLEENTYAILDALRIRAVVREPSDDVMRKIGNDAYDGGMGPRAAPLVRSGRAALAAIIALSEGESNG